MNSMNNKHSGNRIASLLLMAISFALSTSAVAAEPLSRLSRLKPDGLATVNALNGL